MALAESGLPILVEVGIALVALAAAGALSHRIGLSVIPAYILVGILVGPNPPADILGIPLTLVEHRETVEVMAELGVILLLFFLGLEFSVDTLLDDGPRIAAAGTVDFVLNFGLGLALGLAVGLTPVESLFVAGIVYISSSAVVTKSIVENGWVANPEGNVILGTLVFEDVLIAIYLALLSTVALGGGSLEEALLAVGTAFAVLGGLALVAWRGTGLVERAFGAPTDELFLLRILGVTVLVGGVALWSGLSEAVAAFFVGMAFSDTVHTDRIERVIGPARDLFAAVFFLAIGLTTDVTLVAEVAWLLAAAVVLTTITKITSGTVSGRLYDLDRVRSVRVGLGLVPRGEFSLVIAALAAGGTSATLQTVIPAFAVGYVLVMSVLGTLLIQHADRVTDAVERATGPT